MQLESRENYSVGSSAGREFCRVTSLIELNTLGSFLELVIFRVISNEVKDLIPTTWIIFFMNHLCWAVLNRTYIFLHP